MPDTAGRIGRWNRPCTPASACRTPGWGTRRPTRWKPSGRAMG